MQRIDLELFQLLFLNIFWQQVIMMVLGIKVFVSKQ